MTRARRALAVALVALLGALALAGCTQRETKGQYQTKVTQVYELRQKTIAGMQSNGIDDGAYYTGAQQQVLAAVADLQKIVPPKHVEAAHRLYIESLTAMAKVLGEFAHCASLDAGHGSGGSACRAAIPASQFDAVQDDFDNAVQIFRSAGYDLPQVQGTSTQ